MARMTKPLTHTEVKQAKPKEKVYTLSDGFGLQLRVKPNGSKLWLLDYYRPYTKKRTSLSFGSYPEVSLAEARVKREQARKLLSGDIDPQESRDENILKNQSIRSNTLEAVASHWLEVKRSTISEDHANDSWRSLELHIFPSLGKLPISKVTAVKAIAVMKPIAAKGSLETVKRLCQRLNEVMTFAVNTGLKESNPHAGISKAFQSPAKKHYPTIKPDELPELLRNLNVASIRLTTRCLIEWQIHTMVRPGEASGAKWDELDFEKALWCIPAERMKKKKPHTVPLTLQTLALLELMKPISGKSPFIFPSDRNLHSHINSSTANVALKRMGYADKLVAHGMRSIASTALNENGFDSDVIESALAHVSDNDVRNAYNRAEYIERRKVMMIWWSGYIERAAEGNLSLSTIGAFRIA